MALDEGQKITIAKILQITPTILNLQIDALTISATLETAIEAEITRWTTAGLEFVKIHPKERNFGAEIDPEDLKDDIRTNLAMLLERPDWASSATSVQVSLVRG